MTYKFDDEIECFLVEERCDARHHSRLLLFTDYSQFLCSVLKVLSMQASIVGADDGEGTPVPIPNTAVKLTRADNTWLEAAW